MPGNSTFVQTFQLHNGLKSAIDQSVEIVMSQCIAMLLIVAVCAGVNSTQAAPRRNVERERFSGSLVLQPRYLNEKQAGFARPVKITYNACIVDPVMETSMRELPQFSMPCIKSIDEFKFERAPLLRSRGQSVSGLGLTSTRPSTEKRGLSDANGAHKLSVSKTIEASALKPVVMGAKPVAARIDQGGFLASTPAQPKLSADCCGGAPTAPVLAVKTVRGILK